MRFVMEFKQVNYKINEFKYYIEELSQKDIKKKLRKGQF